jgi:hypothetical protein
LNTDATEQCNRLAIGKPLKRNKVSLELRRSAQQNDER